LAWKVYREAKRSFEDLTVTEILAKSSNVGMVHLALRLGEETLHRYIGSFGFGHETGILLPGEEAGYVRKPTEWSKISIGAVAIGQEISVTALQMIRAIAAIANDGYLVTPGLVSQILTPQGDLRESFRPTRRRILKTTTCRTMKQIMGTVVQEGTGKNAALNGWSSAGKTGTAQKFIDGQYSHEKYVASYVGFAPAEDPALVALVVINEPKGIPWGGHVAAPAFKEIMERALVHLKVPHDIPVQRRTHELVDNQRDRKSMGIEDELSDLNAVMVENNLSKGANASPGRAEWHHAEGLRVTVELGKEVLPDFTGQSLREVATTCARLGIDLRISGSGLVVAQRPAPGRIVSNELICEVFLSANGKRRDASTRLAYKNAEPAGISGQLRN
jgi:membrane peptidoglycan carboxypeptidase